MDRSPAADLDLDCVSSSPQPAASPTLSEREQIRIEFYKTYDVMTGVRIAATLGGFFGLMVLLVVYKSKCKSRSLSDEHLEAAAAAAVEVEREEEEQLQALGFMAAAGWGPRRSLGNMSAPTGPYPRFSSLGGGHSLMRPPMRFVSGIRARPDVTSSEPPRISTAAIKISPYPAEECEEEADDDECPSRFLRVPSRRTSRRLSSITCSSADSSYLERRGSAVEVGLPPPPALRRPTHPYESWDFYYPIDIQVVQPTPCTSDGTLYASPPPRPRTPSPPTPRLPLAAGQAPLATISSCQVSSDGSDSVFLDEEYLDTEDEADEFLTDSDSTEADDQRRQLRRHGESARRGQGLRLLAPGDRFHAHRRFSSPTRCERIADISKRPPQPPPADPPSTCPSPPAVRVRPSASVSCDHLVRALREHQRRHSLSARDLIEHCSWSQETLF